MKPHLAKRSFTLAGHRTSVALEPEFWAVLDRVAAARRVSLAALVAELDAARPADTPLASTLRVFALGSRAPG
jgi:predicted DNA-binding ribbon-helix-helix protein